MLQTNPPVSRSLRTVTGNRIWCLFIFGTAEGGIEKSKASFFKEDKAAPWRWFSPPAVGQKYERYSVLFTAEPQRIRRGFAEMLNSTTG